MPESREVAAMLPIRMIYAVSYSISPSSLKVV
jgi:hypothetical protein